MLNLNLWIFMSITSRSHQGLITYESCIQNSAHSIFSLFACHLFPSACGHPGWCQAILYYIGFLGGGKSAGKRTGTNSGQTNSGLENKYRIYSTEIHVTVEGIESSGSCSRLQERKREKFLRWIFRNDMSIKRFEFCMKRQVHGLNGEKGKNQRCLDVFHAPLWRFKNAHFQNEVVCKLFRFSFSFVIT